MNDSNKEARLARQKLGQAIALIQDVTEGSDWEHQIYPTVKLLKDIRHWYWESMFED